MMYSAEVVQQFIDSIRAHQKARHPGRLKSNCLDRYLKAIGADLPLPQGVEGWWVFRRVEMFSERWPDMPWLNVWGKVHRGIYRWRPFSSY